MGVQRSLHGGSKVAPCLIHQCPSGIHKGLPFLQGITPSMFVFIACVIILWIVSQSFILCSGVCANSSSTSLAVHNSSSTSLAMHNSSSTSLAMHNSSSTSLALTDKYPGEDISPDNQDQLQNQRKTSMAALEPSEPPIQQQQQRRIPMPKVEEETLAEIETEQRDGSGTIGSSEPAMGKTSSINVAESRQNAPLGVDPDSTTATTTTSATTYAKGSSQHPKVPPGASITRNNQGKSGIERASPKITIVTGLMSSAVRVRLNFPVYLWSYRKGL